MKKIYLETINKLPKIQITIKYFLFIINLSDKYFLSGLII